jgi:hypothetical protein
MNALTSRLSKLFLALDQAQYAVSQEDANGAKRGDGSCGGSGCARFAVQ